jgi:hypothetical protein
MSGSYSRKPVAVFQSRPDAVRLACLLNSCDASSLSDNDIKTVPYVGESQVIDLRDFDTVLGLVAKTYAAAMECKHAEAACERNEEPSE